MDGGSSPLTSLDGSPSPNLSPIRFRSDPVVLALVAPVEEVEEEDVVIPESELDCDDSLLDEHRDKRVRMEVHSVQMELEVALEGAAEEMVISVENQNIESHPTPIKRPIELPSPPVVIQEIRPTFTSQDIHNLLDDIDPEEFNFLPSSDPQPQRYTKLDMETLQEEEYDSVPLKDDRIEGNGADDSGVFFKSDGMDQTEEGELLNELIKNVAMQGDSGATVEENYGDEMWIGYEEETAAVDLDPLEASTVPPFIAKASQPESEEEDYDKDWDAGKSYAGFDFGAIPENGGGGFGAAAGGGFFTGGGKAVAGPSKENLAKFQARFEQPSPPPTSTSVSLPPPPPPAPQLPTFKIGSQSISNSISKTASTPSLPVKIDSMPLPLAVVASTSAFTGFSSGSGKAIAAASAESVQKSLAMIDAPPDTRKSHSGFVNAWGRSLEASADSREKSKQMLNLSSPPAPLPNAKSIPTIPNADPPPFAGFTKSEKRKGKEIEKPEEDVFDAPVGALTRNGSGLFDPATTGTTVGIPRAVLQGMDNNSRPLSPKRMSAKTSSPSATPTVSSPRSEAAPVPVPSTQTFASQATPRGFRPPMNSTLPRSYTPIASTSKLPPKQPLMKSTMKAFRSPFLVPTSTSKSTPKPKPKPAPALRRINISMQSPKPRTPSKFSFSTPFKNGVRPAGLSEIVTPSSNSKGKQKEVIDRGSVKAVFDLNGRMDRVSMRDYDLKPQGYYYEALQRLGISETILSMSGSPPLRGSKISGAAGYKFKGEKGEIGAFAALSQAGCETTLVWVQNHWSLILWKLASIIRSKPDEISLWNWDVVYKQLLFRYEKEVNNAQRSCIKRIQEHDSPAGLPMILCVSSIRWGDSASTADEEAPQIVVGFELTDGWYRIRAGIDDSLRSACMRGKIVVGSKLVIVGARRESPREGTDVLEALNISSLVISGNSTTLAPWDATLGFVRQTFVASLGSLTSGGGTVAMLDIKLDRIFPYGYIDMGKNSGRETWNEAEEVTREEAYRNGKEKAQARLADELEKAGDDFKLLQDLFEEAAYRVGPRPLGSPTTNDSGEEADEILDRLEDEVHKEALIRKLSARQVHDCLKLIVENTERARTNSIMDLEKELLNCYPPRDVRGFRVARISDASEGTKSSKRTAQLTIWDANSVGADFFQEGKRYKVSNVIPKGTWKHNCTEINLATKRDTRWLMQ